MEKRFDLKKDILSAQIKYFISVEEVLWARTNYVHFTGSLKKNPF